MEDVDYTKLLEEAYTKLEKLHPKVEEFIIPKAEVIIEGNKTIIKNITQIAEKARREKQSIARFLSKELAVPFVLEEKRLILNSKLNEEVINTKIKEYFERFVRCRECKSYDTHFEDTGDRKFKFVVCEACGARYTVAIP
ncbi:MAG: translation initiation factor IF-2 subunit beta [Candidatus Micrarchaeia archaeon]